MKHTRYYFIRVLIFFCITLTGTTYVFAQMGKCKGKYLGNVIDGTTNSGADLKFNTYWNQATAENGCKWGSVESSQAHIILVLAM